MNIILSINYGDILGVLSICRPQIFQFECPHVASGSSSLLVAMDALEKELFHLEVLKSKNFKINKIQKFLEILKQKERMCYLNTLQFDLSCLFLFFFIGVQHIFFSFSQARVYCHSFAYVANFVIFRDVWIRTQSTAIASRHATNLATHLPLLVTHHSLSRPTPHLATHLPHLVAHLPHLATHLPH